MRTGIAWLDCTLELIAVLSILGSCRPHYSTHLLVSTQGKHAEADPEYLRAIEIEEETRGPDHPSLARRLNDRAVSLDWQVRVDGNMEGSACVGVFFAFLVDHCLTPVYCFTGQAC